MLVSTHKSPETREVKAAAKTQRPKNPKNKETANSKRQKPKELLRRDGRPLAFLLLRFGFSLIFGFFDIWVFTNAATSVP
jgi:hypothetical protein